MKIHRSLMTQFIFGALLMVLAVGFLSLSQQNASQLQKTVNHWQAEADKIQLDSLNLKQQAQHYKLNAPRDYESYNRDVKVFYSQFNQQISGVDKAFERANDNVESLLSHPVYQWLADSSNPLIKATQQQAQWHSFWLTFKQGLQNEIGDPAEPRLEWAADYILKNQEALDTRSYQLTIAVTEASLWFNQTFEYMSWFLFSLVITALIISLLWLATRVIRPIMMTAKACEQAAAGDYGVKVKVQGSGETGHLQRSFNQLSARAKLMMDMLKGIHEPGDVNHKLTYIFNSARDALNCNWIGLLAFEEQNLVLNSSAPESLDINFRHRHVSLHKTLGKDIKQSAEQGWLNIESLLELSVKRHDERFLRELHKNTMAKQVVGYPFRCPHNKGFILLFATQEKSGFSKQNVELIKALSHLMADGIISGMAFQSSDPAAFITDDKAALP